MTGRSVGGPAEPPGGGARPGSANRAIDEAAARSAATGSSERNITGLAGLPLPSDTANLRQGPDLHPSLLALLPLVGVWRGEGEGDSPALGTHRFGQQITISHDGGEYLCWQSRAWLLDDSGAYVRPTLRESGFWRIGTDEDETIEVLLAHSSGLVEMFYGAPRGQTSWEMSTDVTIRSATGPHTAGATRLYGVVDGGRLAYVEERSFDGAAPRPHMSAVLDRHAG